MTRDPIGEKGGKNLYGIVGNNLNNKVDLLGLVDSMEGDWGILPSAPEESLPVVVEGPIQALAYYLGGDLGKPNITLSDALTKAAAQAYFANRKPEINKQIKNAAQCGQRKEFSVSLPSDNSFGFGGWNANLGSFQIRATLKCKINCQSCGSAEDCGCKCVAVCSVSMFISKTYTFEREGYNPANNDLGTTIWRAWNYANQNLPWNDGGKQYYISAKTSQNYRTTLSKACP